MRRGESNVRRKQYKLIADEFWEAAGGRDPFPCQLESSVLWSLPVAIIKFPRLCVFDVEAWLMERGIQFNFGTQNRALHGSLLAYRGRGCILLNGADSNSELRYSIAHETAHFILNYLRPRRKAMKIIGPSILDVFDGLRLPTVSERVHGILGRVPIGFHIHLMERDTNKIVDREVVMEVEDSADLLALEIISPEEVVRCRIAQCLIHEPYCNPIDVAERLLLDEFGLPAGMAKYYARYLYPPVRICSMQEWLRQKE